MNALRQFTAMAIFLYASLFIYEKKFFKYIFYILLATMFHTSAILLIILYPVQFLFRIRSTKKYKLFLPKFVSVKNKQYFCTGF